MPIMNPEQDEIISVQQIRDDLNGFIDGLAQGKTYTVLRRSRRVAQVSGTSPATDRKMIPGNKEAIKRSLEYAAQARATAKNVLDPNKSIKELYHEMLDEKYGFPRR